MRVAGRAVVRAAALVVAGTAIFAAIAVPPATAGQVKADRSEEVRQDAGRWLDGLATLATRTSVRPAANEAAVAQWRWPIPGPQRVDAGFDGPAQPWLRGHRGADLTGYDGLPVTAVADGVVAYSGIINGVSILSVQHGDGLRSTYQPVTGGIPRGQSVSTGDRLGYLETLGSHCWPRACLHLGARRGQRYVDPLLLLGVWEVSLLPAFER